MNALEQVEPNSQNMLFAIYWIKRNAKTSFGWNVRADIQKNENLDKLLKRDGGFEEMMFSLSSDDILTLEKGAQEVKEALSQHIQTLEKSAKLEKSTFEENVEKLVGELRFDDIDSDLILFLSEIEVLGNVLHMARDDFAGGDQYFSALATILETTEEKIRQKLSEDSPLRTSEIVCFQPQQWSSDAKHSNRTRDAAYFLDARTIKDLKKPATTGREILNRFVGTELKPELELSDYSHVQGLDHWVMTVAGSIGYPEKGKAFLLGGAPGVGKTQLMPIISQQADAPAYLLGVDFSQIDPESKQDPIVLVRRALKRANYFSQHLGLKALFVVDDAEYAFRDTNDKDNPNKTGKSETNYTLDDLGISAVIITNREDQFDPAYRTRMQPSFMMPAATVARKKEIIKTQIGKYFPDEQVDESTALSLARDASTLSLREINAGIKSVLYKHNIQKNPVSVIADIRTNFALTVKSEGGAFPAPEPLSKFRTVNPELWNAECAAIDPLEMIKHLKGRINSSQPMTGALIHLSGTQGTGRKSFARHCADNMGLEVTECNFSQFLGGLDGKKYEDVLFARFIEAAGREGKMGNALLIKGANDIMATPDPENHPFFRRLLEYSPIAFLATDDFYKEPEESHEVKNEGDEHQGENVVNLASKRKPTQPSLQDTLGGLQATMNDMGNNMAVSMMTVFQQAGLIPSTSGYANAQRLMMSTVTFKPYETFQQKADAYQTIFGEHASDVIEKLPPITVADMVLTKDRAERMPWFEPEQNGGYLGLLFDVKNVPRPDEMLDIDPPSMEGVVVLGRHND